MIPGIGVSAVFILLMYLGTCYLAAVYGKRWWH